MPTVTEYELVITLVQFTMPLSGQLRTVAVV
jgi:hypothetical protein